MKKRYSNFVLLRKNLKIIISKKLSWPKLPAKTYFTFKKSKSVVKERLRDLEIFLNMCIEIYRQPPPTIEYGTLLLIGDDLLLDFLEVEANVPAERRPSLMGEALQLQAADDGLVNDALSAARSAQQQQAQGGGLARQANLPVLPYTATNGSDSNITYSSSNSNGYSNIISNQRMSIVRSSTASSALQNMSSNTPSFHSQLMPDNNRDKYKHLSAALFTACVMLISIVVGNFMEFADHEAANDS